MPVPRANAEKEVYRTTDYELFELFPTNREVKNYHVRRLMEAIERDNRLRDNPIKVTPDGEVLDGQHRLEAARRLEVPVYYTIVDRETAIEDIAEENALTKRWTRTDFMHHFRKMGRQHYQTLFDFMRDFPWLTTTSASALLRGYTVNRRMSQWEREEFMSGRFVVTAYEPAYDMAEIMTDVIEIVPEDVGGDRDFQTAVNQLYVTDESPIEHDEMLRKLSMASHLIRRQIDVESYMRMLEEIYNYHRRDTVRLF